MGIFDFSKKGTGFKGQVVLVVFMFISAILSASILRFGLQKYSYFSPMIQTALNQDVAIAENRIVNENTVPAEVAIGQVKGETDTLSAGISGSENFEATQVNIGSNLILSDDGSNLQLSIYDIKSESFISADKGDSKILISWKTNKPAVSDLEYGKNGQKNLASMKEDSYGFIHSAVLSDLEQKNAYTYRITSKDRFGNSEESDYFGIYTAAKPVSVFDMISKSLNDIFGWAVKKG
ncbi:MAG: hypothetical protein HGB08_04355 [Candidatus Moranbacteria bacterium]|nr:hypothetical protein [Candidatus Moranbacteria bacterium]